MSAIPRPKLLQRAILLALERYLPPVVRRMQRHQAVYSGTIVRGDCQWEIAQRIGVWNADTQKYDRPYTALSGWMAVDGSAYQPCTPLPKEDIQWLLYDLDPLVDRVKADRLAEGLPCDQAVLVAHCTDTHRKHRLRLRAFYERKYAEGGTASVSATPRGPAHGAVCREPPLIPKIAGDEVHCVLEFRRLVSAMAPDATDIIRDYEDAVFRLSAELEPNGEASWRAPRNLGRQGHALLRFGVARTADEFRAEAERCPGALAALKRFLGQANCAESRTWKELFGSHPPRGVVARLSRRCGAALHGTLDFRQYASADAFKKEMRRVRKWYAKRRRGWRRRRGPLRDGQSTHVRSAKCAVTRKVKAHFKRVLKPLKVESLWSWAEVARQIHIAKVPMLRGTNPVEQFWNLLLAMLPPQGTCVTLRWFHVLANLAFLRHNHRLFTTGALPAWTDGDAVLGHRLQAFAAMCEALQTDGTQPPHLQSLFDPFEE